MVSSRDIRKFPIHPFLSPALFSSAKTPLSALSDFCHKNPWHIHLYSQTSFTPKSISPPLPDTHFFLLYCTVHFSPFLRSPTYPYQRFPIQPLSQNESSSPPLFSLLLSLRFTPLFLSPSPRLLPATGLILYLHSPTYLIHREEPSPSFLSSIYLYIILLVHHPPRNSELHAFQALCHLNLPVLFPPLFAWASVKKATRVIPYIFGFTGQISFHVSPPWSKKSFFALRFPTCSLFPHFCPLRCLTRDLFSHWVWSSM